MAQANLTVASRLLSSMEDRFLAEEEGLPPNQRSKVLNLLNRLDQAISLAKREPLEAENLAWRSFERLRRSLPEFYVDVALSVLTNLESEVPSTSISGRPLWGKKRRGSLV